MLMLRRLVPSVTAVAFSLSLAGTAAADDPKKPQPAFVRPNLRNVFGLRDGGSPPIAVVDAGGAVAVVDAGGPVVAVDAGGPVADGGAVAKEDSKEEREGKRKAQAEELKKKYGNDLDKPGVRDELKKHNRRMARLRRIGRLAKAEGKGGIQKRVEVAIVKEKKRHGEAMDKLTKAGAK
jgi:predicted outer membrane protein